MTEPKTSDKIFEIRQKWAPGRVIEVKPGIIQECGQDIQVLLDALDAERATITSQAEEISSDNHMIARLDTKNAKLSKKVKELEAALWRTFSFFKRYSRHTLNCDLVGEGANKRDITKPCICGLSEALANPALQTFQERERARDAVVEAARPVLKAIKLVQPDCYKESDWNVEFHSEIVLTVAECRAIKTAIEAIDQVKV